VPKTSSIVGENIVSDPVMRKPFKTIEADYLHKSKIHAPNHKAVCSMKRLTLVHEELGANDCQAIEAS